MVKRPVTYPVADSSALVAIQVQLSHGDSERSDPIQPTPASIRSPSEVIGPRETPNFDPDVPIPSIEREPVCASNLLPRSNLSVRPRTPSFSITPPAPEGTTTPVPSVSASRGTSPTPSSTVSGLNELIRDLELSGEPGEHPTSHSRSDSLGERHSQTSPTTSAAGRSFVDDVTHALNNIRLGTEGSRAGTPTPETYLNPRSPSPSLRIDDASRSPRSASRRRSSSFVDPAPHNVAEEEPPAEPFHKPEFQRELAKAENLVKDLVNILASSTLHNEAQSRINALHLQAVDLSRFQKPSTRIVGLVGDAGAGKSSVLNSLLDFEGFARSSGSGRACTCVATEYHHHEHDYFAIEMEYFTLDEISSQLTELLQSYRHFHLRTGEDAQDEQSKDLREKAEVAEHTFQAAFRDHLVDNVQLLKEGSEETVLQKLLTWTRNSGLPLGDRPGASPKREVFNEASQCSDRLIELTSEPNSPNQPSTWPFIRKIKVYLNAYILSKGLVLVDLPGLRDRNSARVKITERYLLQCNEIFAVCPIARAIDDTGVKGVFELARRASLSRIAIICTKSEDVRAEEVKNDHGRDVSATIEGLNQNIKKLKASLDENEDDINQIRAFDSDTENEIDSEESQRLVKLHTASRRLQLKTFIVTARNEKVTTELRKIYQSQIPGDDLPVFCVSNFLYWAHRMKPKAGAMPALQLSGILEVRKYCLSIVAQSQLRAAVEYMNNAIPALLGSIELWVQSGAGSLGAERKQAVRDTIRGIESKLDTLNLSASPVNASASSMERQFNAHIVPNALADQNSDDWSEAAENATMEWQGWHHSTYAAFCRNYGDYSTSSTEIRRCWNQEAIQAMVTQMATPWRTFKQALEDSQENLLNRTEDCFDEAIILCGSTNVPTRSLQTLNVTMTHRKALLLSAMEGLVEDFQRDLSTLRTAAFSGIRTSFIGQIMESSYQRTMLEKGRGSDMRRKTIIRDGFSDEQLFANHCRKFRSKFHHLAQSLEDDMRKAVASHLAVLQSDFDTVKDENVALESERHPEFRQRLETAVRNMKQSMEHVNSVVSRFGGSTA
ncbi:hypothetical protein Z517_11817 [Fonsecaea pedrosoi CBS 271.37]|uniref:GGDEF domain-containing protein n=1 Tax=Fonsecaea pedrosoi CBS 271.37 TaxID=1442368 RepID=A0A0D2DBT7_9EURO|nr:uncharacterized protein Z517_11817 [Fonsecaea pedrosoi CBS 271.37]KIW75046.1 hypothetical protein Z517_11817 [Fonsecaea pedrosoi CBS 271.37]